MTAAFAAALCACGTPAPTYTADGSQMLFATPDQAAGALAGAARSGDNAAQLKVLGPGAAPLINSGDPIADQEGRAHFLAAYDARHSFENEGGDKQFLVIGKDEWPLPIPLVRENGKWRFDAASGQEEILNRRIGRNEMNVMQVCRSYVEAQWEYAAAGKQGYAQRFVSTAGKHDGLYWPAAAGESESPFGPLIAQAEAEGYMGKGVHFKRNPYHGYYYRILTQQGSHAPAGAKHYIKNGRMTEGFALIAFPASYGDSGIMTFIVNQNGIVFEKDLGVKTAKIAAKIKSYDPDSSWKIAR